MAEGITRQGWPCLVSGYRRCRQTAQTPAAQLDRPCTFCSCTTRRNNPQRTCAAANSPASPWTLLLSSHTCKACSTATAAGAAEMHDNGGQTHGGGAHMQCAHSSNTFPTTSLMAHSGTGFSPTPSLFAFHALHHPHLSAVCLNAVPTLHYKCYMPRWSQTVQLSLQAVCPQMLSQLPPHHPTQHKQSSSTPTIQLLTSASRLSALLRCSASCPAISAASLAACCDSERSRASASC